MGRRRLDRRLIRVRNAKGGRQRVVPIHPGLVPLFLAYLSTRTPGDDPALFVGVLGRRLSPTILAAAFRRYAEAAGVSKRKRVTPHTLRHVSRCLVAFSSDDSPQAASPNTTTESAAIPTDLLKMLNIEASPML